MPTRPNPARKGQQGGTAAHANLTHPAAPYRNALGLKILCNLPMLTREPWRNPVKQLLMLTADNKYLTNVILDP